MNQRPGAYSAYYKNTKIDPKKERNITFWQDLLTGKWLDLLFLVKFYFQCSFVGFDEVDRCVISIKEIFRLTPLLLFCHTH